MQVTTVMDFFAIPSDVRDIIWGKSRAMLRAERARITTYYVKEVLEEFKRETRKAFPFISKINGKALMPPVVIEGTGLTFGGVSGRARNDLIFLRKYTGFRRSHSCYNSLKIQGNTAELTLVHDVEDRVFHGREAYEAFIDGDFFTILGIF